jgi:hypothetical protein
MNRIWNNRKHTRIGTVKTRIIETESIALLPFVSLKKEKKKKT